MTFEEIERSLPNGFHDCRIVGVKFDALCRALTLTLLLDVSGDEPEPTYRPGRLTAADVNLFFLEPPDARYPFALDGKGLSASGDGEINGMSAKMDLLRLELPQEIDKYRFFLNDWNSFLYVFVGSASFEWTQPQPSTN